MDAKEKERIANLVSNRFWGIGNVIGGVVKAKQAYKARLAEIEKWRETYLPEEIEKQQAKARADYNAARAQAYEAIAAKLDELQSSIQERHAKLDLSNPAWQTSLQLLQSGVRDGETLRKINASFAHDQPALRALRQVYKSLNIAYDGGLDKQIYEIESSFNTLRESAHGAFLQEGVSINSFASRVGKLATLEGVQFEANPDPDGFMEAMRKGAELPKS